MKKSTDLEEFLEFKELPNKVVLFTDKKETSVMFKGMTAIFRDRIDVIIYLFIIIIIIVNINNFFF